VTTQLQLIIIIIIIIFFFLIPLKLIQFVYF